MEKSTIAVLGAGEVGSAISSIFSKKFKVLKKDLKFDEVENYAVEVLHVCINYNASFQKIVLGQIQKNKPKLVIIHSTVFPGTSKLIFEKSQTLVVHSPVMGTHPNLEDDILKFTKFIGPVNKKSAILAKKHFALVGIKTIVLNNPMESEVGKLLDTTYYAYNIIFNKIAALICQNLNLDFENVYKKFNLVYNNGYKDTKPYVRRPILKFGKGPIGGHCLIPNAKIFNQFSPNKLTDLILKANKEFKKES